MSVVTYSDNVMPWLNKPSFACATLTYTQLKGIYAGSLANLLTLLGDVVCWGFNLTFSSIFP